MTGEIAPDDQTLAPYHQLDSAHVLGAVPIAHYLEIAQTYRDPEQLSPNARYDWAWLALETSLAMTGSNDPSSGRKFLPKQVQETTAQARAAFRSVIRDPETPFATGLRAQIAIASVPVYHEALMRRRTLMASPHFKPYAAVLYGVAQSLVELPEASPEETTLANIVAAIGIGTEIAYEQAYFLPAASRQSWHINGTNRHGGWGNKIVISEEESPDMVTIHPDTLTTPALQAGGELFPALAAFASQKIGFGIRYNGVTVPGRKPLSKKTPSPATAELLRVGDQIIETLNNQKLKSVSTVVAAGALALKAPETGEAPAEADSRAEIDWYQSQPADDAGNMPRKNFLTHLESLASAARSGELNPLELRAFAWMQVDNGRILARMAAAEASNAAWEQSQIVRASPAQANEYRRKADRHHARHKELLAQANAQFDAASESLQTALTRTTPEHAGDACEIRLDAEAVPVYKALSMASTPEQLQRTVDAYLYKITHLAPQLRDAFKPVRKNNQQIDTITNTAARTALILLLTGATDETARHLVLPAGPRAGSRRGKADAVIFPIDYSGDDTVRGYDNANPITLNLVPNNDKIEFVRQHIDFGKQKLAKANSAIVPLALRLASVVRTFKGGQNKRQSHGEVMNTIALELSDAVADATD